MSEVRGQIKERTDAIIAVTAAADNCLVTRNIEDFKNIDITLLNPFDNKIA